MESNIKLVLNGEIFLYCRSVLTVWWHVNSHFTPHLWGTYLFEKGRDSAVATEWTVRGSNPGDGEIFRTRPDRPWGHPPPI